jgi:ubiquinone/menaquinone biosynthesis C-methylase UbiE
MSAINRYSGRLQSTARAEAYATRFERGGRKQIDAREQKAVKKIFADLPDVRTVLDVPCGAGRFLRNLSANNRQVTGMDVAADVLEFAKERAKKFGIQAEFKVGDAAHLPFGDSSLDVVFSNRLLHHISNAAERGIFLREFHRVSKHYVVVSFFDYLAFGGLRKFLKTLKGRKVNYAGQPTLNQFKSEVAAAGFRVRSIVPTGGPWVAQKFFVLEKI